MSRLKLRVLWTKICGFSMVKIHFLQKVLKKWSSFRKKYNFFSITGGGEGSGPYTEFSIIVFFNPSLINRNRN